MSKNIWGERYRQKERRWKHPKLCLPEPHPGGPTIPSWTADFGLVIMKIMMRLSICNFQEELQNSTTNLLLINLCFSNLLVSFLVIAQMHKDLKKFNGCPNIVFLHIGLSPSWYLACTYKSTSDKDLVLVFYVWLITWQICIQKVRWVINSIVVFSVLEIYYYHVILTCPSRVVTHILASFLVFHVAWH